MTELPLIFLLALIPLFGGWSKGEKRLVRESPEVMRVLTVDDRQDNQILRSVSTGLSVRQIKSATFRELSRKMVATVTDPSQDGVGIAGPQVGILKRVIAVQRLDKPGGPFEVYPNVRIKAARGPEVAGPEGCLSVPGKRGDVLRSREIDVQYTSLHSYRDTVETVRGFTAVIFQHECDHLEGVIYTDRIR